MANLLYPAIHGTLLYTLFQVVAERFSASLTEPHLIARRSIEAVFLASLLVHFAIDYLYTVINEFKPNYKLPAFLFDLTIVACLFLAGSAVSPKFNESAPVLANPAIWLAIGKLAAVIWEGLLFFEDKHRSKFGILSDSYFCLIYAFLAFVYKTSGLGPVFAVLIFDTFAYFVHPVFHRAREA